MYFDILVKDTKTGRISKKHLNFRNKAEAMRYCRLKTKKSKGKVIYSCQQ